MIVVIFKASIAKLDAEYRETAARMRELAMARYGCTEFSSTTEDGMEISVSHWPDLAHVQAWKNDPEHLMAQQLGRDRWYASYSVQVAELIREYGSTD